MNVGTSLKEMKIPELANSIDPDKAAQNEPPYLDLHRLRSILGTLNDTVWTRHFF